MENRPRGLSPDSPIFSLIYAYIKCSTSPSQVLALFRANMDFILLAKVPCLLLVAGYHHLAFTSPNPPASAKNRQFVPSIADRILKGIAMIHALDYIKYTMASTWRIN